MNAEHENGKLMEAAWQIALIFLMAVILAFGVNYLRPSSLPLFGQNNPKDPPGGIDDVDVQFVSIEEARALFLTDGAVFVDARPAETYNNGHIRGALNLPAESLDTAFQDVTAQIPTDSLVIAYCDGQNCPLSKEVALELSAKGYSHVQVLVNGWTAWKEAGLPVEKSGSGNR